MVGSRKTWKGHFLGLISPQTTKSRFFPRKSQSALVIFPKSVNFYFLFSKISQPWKLQFLPPSQTWKNGSIGCFELIKAIKKFRKSFFFHGILSQNVGIRIRASAFRCLGGNEIRILGKFWEKIPEIHTATLDLTFLPQNHLEVIFHQSRILSPWIRG